MDKFIVGITGGIASGKTAVSDTIERLGGFVIDADVVSRTITAVGGEAYDEIAKAFPFVVKDGLIDRVALRNTVFSDSSELKRLNAITHPIIERVISRSVSEYNGSVVFLVVPLLFEAGYDKICNYIVSVISDETVRIERLKKRNNTVTDETARGIITAQMDDEQRKMRSNEIIVNDGSLSELEAKVTEFYHRITKRSAK